MDGRASTSTLRKTPPATAESIRSGLDLLTPREKEILEGILSAESAKHTALRLNISHRTVETHRGRIFEKLRARGVLDIMRVLRPTEGGIDVEFLRSGEDFDEPAWTDGGNGLFDDCNVFSDVRYAHEVEANAVTVMMTRDADGAASGFVMLPADRGPELSSVHNPAFDGLLPLESALAYGFYLSLKSQTAMRLAGDLGVWKPRWGTVPGLENGAGGGT